MEKLQIIPVDYGLGKFYIYRDEKNKRYPCIEMNMNMLKFDEELFVWVFNHELDHYRFYSNPENEGKQCSFIKEVKRLITNPRMFIKLFRFEMNHKRVYEKRFSFNPK